MTDFRHEGAIRPFGPGELDGVPDIAPDELAGEAAVARDLEALAGRTGTGRTGDFVDRVMAAVAAEPVPAPARVARLALRRGAIGAFFASLGDAWRVSTRPGFPVAVRAQAFALVLLVAGLAAGSGIATAGAIGMLEGDRGGPSPAPSLEAPSVPSETSSVEDATPSAATEDESIEPTASPEPTESETATPEPTGTPEPTETGDDNGGDRGGQGGGSGSSGSSRTPRPTATPDDDSGGDHGGDGGGDGGGDDDATQTPKPSETPHSDSGDDSTSPSGDH